MILKKLISEAYFKNKTHIKKTPLIFSEYLSSKYDNNIFLKREDLQYCRSFKFRGAFNKINGIDTSINKTIVCASAGNHAQGVAYSSNINNINAIIYIPNNTPVQKKDRIKYYGNDNLKIVEYGDTFNECLDEALSWTDNKKYEFIHPYDDIDIIIGQGTIAKEIDEELYADYILCPIGGGGLISGLTSYYNNLEYTLCNNDFNKFTCSRVFDISQNKYTLYDIKNFNDFNNKDFNNKDFNNKDFNNNDIHTEIIGVEPTSCPSMKLSIEYNKIIDYPVTDNFVDGSTVSKPGELPFKICSKYINNIQDIDIGLICSDMIDLYQNEGIIMEPAGALSVSGLHKIDKNIKGKNIVCIVSGGNNDLMRYPEILDRSLRYRDLKFYFIVEFIQKPGELRRFINNVLDKDDDIIRFEYMKKTNKDYGNVLIGIQVKNSMKKQIINDKLYDNNFKYEFINENNILFDYLI